MPSSDPDQQPTPLPHPLVGLTNAVDADVDQLGTAVASEEPTTPLKKSYTTVLLVAYAALYLAWIAPLSFSLAVRVEQIDAAAKNTALPLVIGIPGLVILLTSPLLGVLSDRTRGRLGRRRPWFAAGSVLGIVGSVIAGSASSIALLIVGWTVAYIGYTAVNSMVLTHLGDRLPEVQRGRVAGLTGSVTQIAPIVGVVLAGVLTAMPLVMFLGPATIALLGATVFVIVMKDPPLTEEPPAVDVRALLEGFWFNPRRHPDVGWLWLSRAFIFMALSMMNVYAVYLLAIRLHLEPAGVAGIVATAGIVGVAAGVTGALLSGWLSDKLKRRKPFLLGSAIILAVGLVITGAVSTAPQYILGTIVAVFGIGVYSAVDQATILDVLPQEEGQNGRYLAILNLANQIPQAVGPFLAGGILGLSGGSYGVLYVVGAIVALVGGLLILPLQIAGRTTDPVLTEPAPDRQPLPRRPDRPSYTPFD